MKHLLIGLISVYEYAAPVRHQVMLSVFGMNITCRQNPSCSRYTIQQIKTHGTITGLKLGINRILRCHSTRYE